MTEASATPPESAIEKMQSAERVLSDILRLMEVPARLELKDAPPSPLDKGAPGISVAVHLAAELPGTPTGKRSSFSDALQFLANKIVNRGGPDKRWILVGIGGHPEPRPVPPPKKGPQGAAPAPASAPVNGESRPAPVAAPASQQRGPAPAAAARPDRQAGRPGRSNPSAVDEAALTVPPDEAVSALGLLLGQKSAALGRYYGVVGLSLEDRARMLQATRTVSGVTAKVEGEGKAKRLVFVPETPVPMPKRAFPDFDDEDEQED